MARLEPGEKAFIGVAQQCAVVTIFLARLLEMVLDPPRCLLQCPAAIVRDMGRLRDADPLVDYCDAGGLATPFHPHRNRPPIRAVLDGILNQVLERLLQAHRVAVEDERRLWANQVIDDRVCRIRGLHRHHHLLHERGEIKWCALDAELPRLHPGDIEEGGDQPVESARLVRNHVERPRVTGG
jgi:hypothetical protein